MESTRPRGVDVMPVVVAVDERAAAHVVVALVDHIGRLRRNGCDVPVEVRALLEVFAAVRGQSAPLEDTGLVGGGSMVDAEPVLLSFGTAARRLGCSPRTVGRMVRAGRLSAVGRRVTASSVEALAGAR